MRLGSDRLPSLVLGGESLSVRRVEVVAPLPLTMKNPNDNQRMRDSGTFWRALLVGMACPSLVLGGESLSVRRVEVGNVLDRDAMRGDWVRVGEDFRRVIAREETAHADRK